MIVWLIRAYFAANALLYGAIAIRTTLDPDAAAAASGFTLGSAEARSEYLTAYAGLLFGLALMFAVFAIGTSAQRTGLIVAAGFYAPIVVYRIVPPTLFGGRYSFSVGATTIELFLLMGAVTLLGLGSAG